MQKRNPSVQLKPAQHNRNKKSEINYSSRFFHIVK